VPIGSNFGPYPYAPGVKEAAHRGGEMDLAQFGFPCLLLLGEHFSAHATARVALEEKSLPLHDPEDALVVGRCLALCGQQSVQQGGDAPIAVGSAALR
jgi:hypothetical protein